MRYIDKCNVCRPFKSKVLFRLQTKYCDYKPFETRVWLASPTMHGDGIKHMAEAMGATREAHAHEADVPNERVCDRERVGQM